MMIAVNRKVQQMYLFLPPLHSSRTLSSSVSVTNYFYWCDRRMFAKSVNVKLLLGLHNCSHWLRAFSFKICSWRNTNKAILVIALGSIVKISICFLLVSCCFVSSFFFFVFCNSSYHLMKCWHVCQGVESFLAHFCPQKPYQLLT